MPTPIKQGPIYHNCTILAPDGQVLCRTNRKKIDWYLERGLAEPVTIRLLFEPSGRKNADDPYYMADKANRCVVCGTKDGLTLHHVVPRCYRKHFPNDLKDHTSHDVVAVCVGCHNIYESHAMRLKTTIAEEYGCPLTMSSVDHSILRVRKAARALRHHEDVIPEPRKRQLQGVLEDYLGRRLRPDDVEELSDLDPSPVGNSSQDSHGSKVVARVKDVHAFICQWREHFIRTMNPAHLPNGWDPSRRD